MTLVVFCGHQCTGAREWSVCSHLRCEMGLVCLWCAVYPCQKFCSACMCCLLEVYIYVCNSDVFSVVNMYLDHLKFFVLCINGRMYVFCGECYVVSNECDEPTLCLVRPINGGLIYQPPLLPLHTIPLQSSSSSPTSPQQVS